MTAAHALCGRTLTALLLAQGQGGTVLFFGYSSSGAFPVPQVEYTSVEYTGNKGGTGPGIGVTMGHFVLRFRQCIFRDNVARISGAAIDAPALPGSQLIVEATLFERNAVRVPADGRTIDVTVLLYSKILLWI